MGGCGFNVDSWLASVLMSDILFYMWIVYLPTHAGPESSYDSSRSGKLSFDRHKPNDGRLTGGGAASVTLRLPYDVLEDLTCFPFQVIALTPLGANTSRLVSSVESPRIARVDPDTLTERTR